MSPQGPVVALVNCHGPDGVEPAAVNAGEEIPDSWRVQVGSADDYVEQLIATGGAGSRRKFLASDLAEAHKPLGDNNEHRDICTVCDAVHGRREG